MVRRYAGALFAIARERGLVEDLGREVDFLGELFEDQALGAFLRNPRIASAEKRRIFLDKVGPHVSPLMRNLVELLFDRGREEVLEGLALAYRGLSREAMKLAVGVVETARPLSVQEKADLEAAFARQLGLSVTLAARENPSLIGGVRVTVANRRIDSSIAGGLESLHARLLGRNVR